MQWWLAHRMRKASFNRPSLHTALKSVTMGKEVGAEGFLCFPGDHVFTLTLTEGDVVKFELVARML